MKKILLLCLFSGFLAVTGCVISNPQAASVKTVTATTWILQDEDGDVVSYNNESITMSFEAGDGILRVSGFAGCNRYFGNARVQPGIMRFQDLGSTKMACPEMETESTFLNLMERVDAYTYSNSELSLYQGKMLLLKFRAK